MTRLDALWESFKLLSSRDTMKNEELAFLERFLAQEEELRQQKRISYLLARSGIKRVKTLADFDWTFMTMEGRSYRSRKQA